MFSKETRDSFIDSVNDTIDVVLDSPARIVGELALPVVCLTIVFFAGSLGFFDGVLPDAGWGLLTLPGVALYAGVMLTRMYMSGALAAPECGASK